MRLHFEVFSLWVLQKTAFPLWWMMVRCSNSSLPSLGYQGLLSGLPGSCYCSREWSAAHSKWKKSGDAVSKLEGRGTRWDTASSAGHHEATRCHLWNLMMIREVSWCLEKGKHHTPPQRRARKTIRVTTGCQLNSPGKVIRHLLLEAVCKNRQDQ